MRTWTLGVVLTVLLAAGPGRAADPTLAQKARQVLKAHCSRCHGDNGSHKGGMDFILDRDRLVVRNKLVPGDPARSAVYQRTAAGEMPPEGAKPRPGAADIAVLKQWIEAGAPSTEAAPAARPLITEADLLYFMLADLKATEPRHRRFIRYFSFHNLVNAGAGTAALQRYHHALSKLVNSLSWHPRVTVPRTLDPAGSLVRIDLRDYQWTASQWNRVVALYPYTIPSRSAWFRAVAAATATELPYLRADWFVATASQPPLYHDLLQLPTTDRDLERQLRVDVPLDIQEDRVVRAGFNGSGVARNNRLLERHDGAFGAYWRSYDFADNTGRQNLFEHPLGPFAGGNGFEHSGGEIIFNLPNGLQAYLLVDANGRRLDRAPLEIVSDPKRPDRAVTNGLSCMSCHFQGLIHKADQVRAHVEKNSQVFGREEAAVVRAQYVAEDRFKALLDEDAERFRKALARTGAPAGEPEPIVTLALRYEGEVDLPAAAGELGLTPGQFRERLNRSPALGRLLGALQAPGGTVQRQVFQTAFPDLVREFGLGTTVESPANPNLLAVSPLTPRPFQGHTGFVLALAFSPDGKRALSGSEDATVRLWEVATGREIRPLEGHSGDVLAVAFSPDGKRALSGGMDRTVRLWDLTSGRELRRLEGHTERVSSVAFSPDGKRALSGSWDQTVSLWDLETGKELFRLGGHTSYVSSVAVSPDGGRALSGSYDHTVRLWDLKAGKPLRVLEGSAKEVYSVAFAPDGRHALSGGNDGVVRLWDLEAGREVRRFDGLGRPVIRVAFAPDGGRVLAGGSRYEGAGPILRVWTASGRDVGRFGAKTDTAWSIAFAPDGRHALSAGSDKTLRLWDLSK